ncbi:penicillin-binding transpeptidase domain-containing protein [Lactobacillus sp. YT155]|uniref:penicillin-binding transpeptidase domain-containing protein n=1 Tax=Lactobacillus sp. YT155 TaxID=3060955 RepID=UPI00265E95D4|nr:penicillin-binding transpeptidase domain-containing protein [Lactobacillus sp. YT155]MDO1605265.1 penicillin-binding transpeptidase domain-containing protein [Lactobacillus sp. YT155]
MNNNHKKNNLRAKSSRTLFAKVLVAAFALIFVIFIFQFAKIAMTGQAKGQNLSYRTKFKYTQKNPLIAQRGNIFDANGDMVASNAGEFSIYAILDKQNRTKTGKIDYVKDKEKTAEVLSKYLALDKETILKYLNSKKKAFQVEFGSAGKKLSLHTKEEISAEKLPGIKFFKTPSRSYPNGIFASNLVGITKVENKKDATDIQKISGIMGIEKEFDNQLAGKDGIKISKVDTSGNELPETKVVQKQSKDGDDVYLTIDSKIQDYLEILMSDVQSKYQPRELKAVVMDSKTGAIRAMSQRPTFNPSNLSGLSDSWKNTLVEDQYEPGSVMKIMTLSAAIDSGNYNPNGYYQSGSVKVDDRTISDWNKTGWGSIPLSQAFPRSSNVGMVKLEQAMGSDVWLDYLKKFKMGEKTGITLPNETNGAISFEHRSDQAMTSFGQSINVNTLQMLQATSAIANGGKMIKPYIVDKVVNPNTEEVVEKTKTQSAGTPIKKETADQVMDAMKQVVSADYGTGRVYAIPGYENNIAVKTGTAQIASPNGGYLTGSSNYIYSVMGILPANNPRYIVYITIKQPQRMTQSAEKILSEIFNPLAQRLLQSTVKQAPSSISQIEVGDLIGESVEEAKQKVTKLGLTPCVIGTGSKIVQQLPKSKAKILSGQKVLLLTNGAMTMPDVSNWSQSDILKLSEVTGIKIKTKGSGYVTSQNLKPGEIMSGKKNIEVTLAGR